MKPGEPTQGKRRGSRRIVDAAAVLVLVAGWSWVVWPAVRPARALPPVDIQTDDHGAPAVSVDMSALRSAFAAAGLPDPPDLNGADPIPVENLLRYARQWSRTASIPKSGASSST